MAEGRMLKKKISMSRRLAALKTDSARLLYTWLIPHLDIEGRYSSDPAVVKGQVVPRLKHITEDKVDQYLTDMAQNELIYIYSNDGDRFLQLRHFREEQNIREDREKKSTIPPPDECEPSYPGELPADSGHTPAEVKLSYIKIRQSKAREVIDYLNEIGGRAFSYSDSNLKPIIGRLDEDHTLEECKLVIDRKWEDKDFDKKYFRPVTLFRASNFEGYLNEECKPQGKGTPLECKECGTTGVYIGDEGYCAVCEGKAIN